MNPQTTDELREFHAFVGEKLKNGSADLSPEDALDEWRETHPDPEAFEDDTAAIQDALDDMENGDDGRDFDEVVSEIRAKFGLPKP